MNILKSFQPATTRGYLSKLRRNHSAAAKTLVRGIGMAGLIVAASLSLSAEVITSSVTGGANTTGPFSFGQSVTTPAGGPWNNLQFNFAITEPGQEFDPAGTGAIGTLFLLSQSYAGTPANLSGVTPGFLASTATINGGIWQFAADVTLQPNTQYYFYMGSLLGASQAFWSSNMNPYAGGGQSQAFTGQNYASVAGFDAVFVLQGDVAATPVPEPGSFAQVGGTLALSLLGLAGRSRRS